MSSVTGSEVRTVNGSGRVGSDSEGKGTEEKKFRGLLWVDGA